MASSPEYIARGRGGGGGAAGVACEAGGAFAFGVRLARAADVEEKRGKETRKKKSAGGEKKKGKKRAGGSGGWLIGWGPGVDATSCLIVFHTCLTAVHSCN